MFGDDLIQGIDAKVGMHCTRQRPAQDLARGPIHDRDQVKEAIFDWHEGDVGAPNLIGPVDLHLPQHIWIDWLMLSLGCRAGSLIVSLPGSPFEPFRQK